MHTAQGLLMLPKRVGGGGGEGGDLTRSPSVCVTSDAGEGRAGNAPLAVPRATATPRLGAHES